MNDATEPSPAPHDSPRVVVFGGYGVFGSIVSRELAGRGISVTIAGRNIDPANALAGELGTAHHGAAANMRDMKQCADVVAGHRVAVNCAGPFVDLGPELLNACLDAGCHYVDIADDRAYCQMVREHGGAFAKKHLTAAYGCSSLPGISLAAAMVASEHCEEPPELARVTLFIGNDNLKGHGAVASASRLVGREIAAPQGTLRGFRHRERVPLPAPFGPRTVLNFESPDYDLLPERMGVAQVRVKVGFELSLANWAFNTFASLAPRVGRKALPMLGKAGDWVRGIGCSGGVVMTELFWPDGDACRVAVVAKRNGQRLAALPAVYVAQALCRADNSLPTGAVTTVDVLGARELLARLEADGHELISSADCQSARTD